jgi:hypothetical protein
MTTTPTVTTEPSVLERAEFLRIEREQVAIRAEQQRRVDSGEVAADEARAQQAQADAVAAATERRKDAAGRAAQIETAKKHKAAIPDYMAEVEALDAAIINPKVSLNQLFVLWTAYLIAYERAALVGRAGNRAIAQASGVNPGRPPEFTRQSFAEVTERAIAARVDPVVSAAVDSMVTETSQAYSAGYAKTK